MRIGLGSLTDTIFEGNGTGRRTVWVPAHTQLGCRHLGCMPVTGLSIYPLTAKLPREAVKQVLDTMSFRRSLKDAGKSTGLWIEADAGASLAYENQ